MCTFPPPIVPESLCVILAESPIRFGFACCLFCVALRGAEGRANE